MLRPRLLVTRRLPQPVEDHFRAHYEVTLNAGDVPMERAALVAAMTRYDAICPTITDRFDAEILGTPGATVKILANFGAGHEHIDLGAAKRAGIAVTNTPDVLTDATADLAILLMLMATRRAGEGERELRAGKWTGWRPTHMIGQGLSGKVLGLVGYGRIARATAKRARNGFGMRIAYHGRREATDAEGAEFHPTLASLMAAADVLSLHVPGGAETRHMIDAAALAAAKPGQVIVNTARGSAIDEEALAAALAEGRVAAAGLDVYEREPLVHPALLVLENVVLLPHLGSATIETRTAMGMRAAANLEAFFEGREPSDRVA